MNAAIDAALQNLALLIGENRWLAPAIALLAGMLTSLTPCALSSIPLVVAYVGGTGRNNPRIAFRLSLVIALGMSITFTVLGVLASLLGRILNFGTGGWWYVVLGTLMIAMAFQTWGIITIIPSSYAQSKNTKRGYLGAFITGIMGGLFSSPCATPVLITLLALVASEGTPVWGILLLLLYSIGHSILVIASGSFMGLTGKLTQSSRYGVFARIINILLGTGILLAGLYLLYLGF